MSVKKVINALLQKNAIKGCLEQLLVHCPTQSDAISRLAGSFEDNEKKHIVDGIVERKAYLEELNRIKQAIQQIADCDEEAITPIQEEVKQPPPLPNPQTCDYTHALRPTCTQIVLHGLLMRRQSVNLKGDSGHGKSRLLRDIQHIAQQQGIPVALLNLKDHRLNYAQFLQSACVQLGIAQKYTTFGDLAHSLGLQKDRHFLLLIDNLEVLNEYHSKDSCYDQYFVSSINLLKNMDNIHLLFASEKWLKKVVFGGETSLLTLHQLALSPLSQTEIQGELQRELAPLQHPFLDKTNEQIQLRKAVQEHPKPCNLLECLISRLKTHYPTQKFKDLLNHCLQNEK
jgi:hypothetical protein